MANVRTGNAAHSSHGVFAHPHRNVRVFGIEPGMRVADFGSGSGAYVLAMAERLEGNGRVYAIDIQKELLRRTHNEAARSGFKNVEVLWGDLEAPHGSKVKDSTLDFVLISNLMFQVSDRDAVVQEATRILRPSGRLAIIDWEASFNNMGPHKDEVLNEEDAYALAQRCGLVYVNTFEAGAHHYGLIFRKPATNRGTIKLKRV